MLDVFITVDTEIWWSEDDLSCFAQDFDRWFYGRTATGEYGVAHQIRVLNGHGLKAVFFVEPLFSLAVGLDPLREMVRVIQDGGHDVQLHIHTEWLRQIDPNPVGDAEGEHICSFTLAQQTELIGKALARLREAGAENVCAFRAGNYGANFDTLRALAANGLRYDSSYNYCYLHEACGLIERRPIVQPEECEGVVEVPISFFADLPGHHRHVQLNAVSFDELRHALDQAHQRGWDSFVIVSHSFELLDSARRHPDPFVIRRFELLCEYLRRHPDRFRTAVFDGSLQAGPPRFDQPLQGRKRHTAWRLVEQTSRRVLTSLRNRGRGG